MNNELISVIIPVYNVKDYIHICLKSVINQTYKNLEILLVDDGSFDGSEKICDDYKEIDGRIKVIHKDNKGLSDTRNVGIDNCSGKYVTFVDSDDYIPDNAIEVMYNALINCDVDIAAGQYKEVFDHNEDTSISDYEIIKLNTEESLEMMMYMKVINNCSVAKLYNKKVFEGTRYPVGKNYEDMATTYKIMANSSGTAVVDTVVYYYFQRDDSITHSIINKSYSKKRLVGLKYAFKELAFIKKEFPDIVNSARCRIFVECITVLRDMPVNEPDKKIIKKLIKRYRRFVLHDKKAQKKDKVLCYISYFGQIGVKLSFVLRRMVINTRFYQLWNRMNK